MPLSFSNLLSLAFFFLRSHPHAFKSTAGSLSRVFELVFRNHLSAISTIFNGFLKHIRAHTHTHGKKKKERERESGVYLLLCVLSKAPKLEVFNLPAAFCYYYHY